MPREIKMRSMAEGTATSPPGPGPAITPAKGVVVAWDVWGTDGARKAVFLECRQAAPAAAVAQALVHAQMKYGDQLGELGRWRFEVERSAPSGSTVHRFRIDEQGQIVAV